MRTFSLIICLQGLSQPITTIRTIKISPRNQGSSKRNLVKVPKKVHLQPLFPLLSLSIKTSPKTKRNLNQRVRSRFININLSLKLANSSHNTKKLSLSRPHLPPTPNRNNNRSHKRKSPNNSPNSRSPRGHRGSNRQPVPSSLRVSMSRRTSRCTSAPKSVNSRSLREKRSLLTLRSR
jgi:hypothetical protein